MKKLFLVLLWGIFISFALQASAHSSVLSNKDVSLYKSIFDLQKKKEKLMKQN